MGTHRRFWAVLALSAPISSVGAETRRCGATRSPVVRFDNNGERALLHVTFKLGGCKRQDMFAARYSAQRVSVPWSQTTGQTVCAGMLNGTRCHVRVPLRDWNRQVDVDAAVLEYEVTYPTARDGYRTLTHRYTCVRATESAEASHDA